MPITGTPCSSSACSSRPTGQIFYGHADRAERAGKPGERAQGNRQHRRGARPGRRARCSAPLDLICPVGFDKQLEMLPLPRCTSLSARRWITGAWEVATLMTPNMIPRRAVVVQHRRAARHLVHQPPRRQRPGPQHPVAAVRYGRQDEPRRGRDRQGRRGGQLRHRGAAFAARLQARLAEDGAAPSSAPGTRS